MNGEAQPKRHGWISELIQIRTRDLDEASSILSENQVEACEKVGCV